MKSLSDYTQEAQTQLFKDCGAFFAFSPKQLSEARQESVKYVGLGNGLLCDKTHYERFIEELESINSDGIKLDIAENGIDAIIQRELANYESQITMDIDDTVDALQDYPITREQVQEGYKIFFDYCVENDLF